MPNLNSPKNRFCRGILATVLPLALIGTPSLQAEESDFAGLIRGKSPDRGVYQPPALPQAATVRAAVEVPSAFEANDPQAETNEINTVGYEESAPGQPMSLNPSEPSSGSGNHSAPRPRPSESLWAQPDPHFEYDNSCDAFPHNQCDGACCAEVDAWRGLQGCTDPDRWFGSVELLLMFRSGDTLPILATTSAGGLGQGVLPVGPPGDTRILFGNERVLDDMTAGGRFTLGTWLDPQRSQSLVVRGWGAGDDSFRFARESNGSTVIARPFLNTDPFSPGSPIADSLPIAGVVGGQANIPGRLSIEGSNEVYGADVALRRQWLAGLGGVIEVLYGYQHVRMQDHLAISSVSLPVPNVVSVRDQFDADNIFHGGQFGLASRYREGCWSFDGLIKVAAGSIRREAYRTGVADVGSGPTAPGLLVGLSNSTAIRNSTFGWVPELSASLGYRYTENLDFTFGYHVLAMSDALQASGMIDPDLAVNRNPAAGPNDPSPGLRFDTYYVHGIQFGLQYVY